MRCLYLILFVNCWLTHAQSPIKPLFNPNYGDTPNAYYKDLDNDFTYYVGTWQYSNGPITFTVTFQKKNMEYMPNFTPPIYRDFLIGAYSYTVNGTTLVNTLPQLTGLIVDAYDYSMYSSVIMRPYNPPSCSSCAVNERRICMEFTDPTRTEVLGLAAELILRKFTENGVQKIKAVLWSSGQVITVEGQEPPYYQFTVPFGEYTFTKVN